MHPTKTHRSITQFCLLLPSAHLNKNCVRVLLCERLELGQDHLAGSAPGGGVVDHHELVLVVRGQLVKLRERPDLKS